MTKRFWNVLFIAVGVVPLALIGLYYLFMLIDDYPLMPGLQEWIFMLAGLALVVLGFWLLRKGSRTDRIAGIVIFIILLLLIGWFDFSRVFSWMF
jgi:hypothetical protein